MINKRNWSEFRDAGMLWWINMILHTFGWAIVVEIDNDNNITNAYPARVKFRGFSEKHNSKGYEDVSKYLNNNIFELLKESQE